MNSPNNIINKANLLSTNVTSNKDNNNWIKIGVAVVTVAVLACVAWYFWTHDRIVE